MLTDAPPRKANRASFLEIDRLISLSVPQGEQLVNTTKLIEQAMQSQNLSVVRSLCLESLRLCSTFYQVPQCGIRVLAARPLRVREGWSTELFGDYAPETMLIRVWMK